MRQSGHRHSGRALYFSASRSFRPRQDGDVRYFKHLGFYALSQAALDASVRSLIHIGAQRALSSLRCPGKWHPDSCHRDVHDTIGVDTEDDLKRVEGLILART